MKKLFVAALTAVAFVVAGSAAANDDSKLPGSVNIENATAAAFAVAVAVTIVNGSSTPVIDDKPVQECKDGEELVNGVCVPTTTITVTNSVTTTVPVTTSVTTTRVN